MRLGHLPHFNRGVVFALGAAALFGGSTPFAKLLLGGLPPVLLAGLLYLGSGVGLTPLPRTRFEGVDVQGTDVNDGRARAVGLDSA